MKNRTIKEKQFNFVSKGGDLSRKKVDRASEISSVFRITHMEVTKAFLLSTILKKLGKDTRFAIQGGYKNVTSY